MSLSGVAIAKTDNTGGIIYSGSFKTGGSLSQISGVAVIPNPQPGKYKVIKINTWNMNMWEKILLPSTKDYWMEISAGNPVYFGQLNVRQPIICR